ncbi:DUF4097 family beta strand repeat-containing protein [Nocardioides bigeumensis]|uniref:DUF4097 domain-containing protein n=1 Tax=Nocardioides bigeumensis TaxID=433657 RepID=A0ABN2YWN4_9ACTN
MSTTNDQILERQFEAHGPLSLYVENNSGLVHVNAHDTTEASVTVTGRDAEHVTVTYDDGRLSVVAPKQRTGFFGGSSSLDMTITVPTRSELMIKSGSADVVVDGTCGATQVKSGSGEVTVGEIDGPAQLETGSGDIGVQHVHGELRCKSGSGDVDVRRADSAVAVSTGSGDVRLGSANGPAVVKTGSGDLRVVEAAGDVSMATGSGDVRIETARKGRFSVKGASSDVEIGIPAGIPVWTDINTLSGHIRSDLAGAGKPEEGADYIEVRAKTVSGDITLTQI